MLSSAMLSKCTQILCTSSIHSPQKYDLKHVLKCRHKPQKSIFMLHVIFNPEVAKLYFTNNIMHYSYTIITMKIH